MITTKKHFQIYQDSVRKWLDYFGLKDWNIHFQHYLIKDETRACVAYRVTGRICTFSLNTTWGDWPVNDEQVMRCGFHEVCEVLFAKVSCMLDGKISYHPDTVNEEIHRLIRILENTIYKDKEIKQ